MCELFKKVKINQISMNQNQKSVFKAICHVIIIWLTWMKRKFTTRKCTFRDKSLGANSNFVAKSNFYR